MLHLFYSRIKLKSLLFNNLKYTRLMEIGTCPDTIYFFLYYFCSKLWKFFGRLLVPHFLSLFLSIWPKKKKKCVFLINAVLHLPVIPNAFGRNTVILHLRWVVLFKKKQQQQQKNYDENNKRKHCTKPLLNILSALLAVGESICRCRRVYRSIVNDCKMKITVVGESTLFRNCNFLTASVKCFVIDQL